MELFRTIVELRNVLDSDRDCGHSIGFVPTMGALHQGHLALVDRAARENKKVVVSIFVNPNQFNDPNDLRNYPRNLEADIAILNTVACDYVFAPSVEEVYPAPDVRIFDFGELEAVMEGRFRPGHFNGVAQVVSRLFDMVTPDRAYFGLKDFQQYSIIRSMVERLMLPIDIVPCDIVRESDGLAMSSRNALLSKEHRQAAPIIYSILREALDESEFFSPEQVKNSLIRKVDSIELLRIEYFEIVDEVTLQPINRWDQPGRKVGCIAVFAGSVRLIDNIVFDK